jgi:hypothetical protein
VLEVLAVLVLIQTKLGVLEQLVKEMLVATAVILPLTHLVEVVVLALQVQTIMGVLEVLVELVYKMLFALGIINIIQVVVEVHQILPTNRELAVLEVEVLEVAVHQIIQFLLLVLPTQEVVVVLVLKMLGQVRQVVQES